jgi:hypothetical protein
MIARVWHGWTTQANADVYERLLKTEIFPGILAKGVDGFEEIELFRRDLGSEVEFMTIMWFRDIEAVKSFAGVDYEAAYVPAKAQAILSRFDARSQHYQIREPAYPHPPVADATGPSLSRGRGEREHLSRLRERSARAEPEPGEGGTAGGGLKKPLTRLASFGCPLPARAGRGGFHSPEIRHHMAGDGVILEPVHGEVLAIA